MAIQHSAITDPQIHEPKGASTASANTAYFANGAGSGSWRQAGVADLDMNAVYNDIEGSLDDGSLPVPGRFYIVTQIADISTASSVIVPIIQDCTVIGASVVLGAAISGADAAVSFSNSAGAGMGTPVTVAYASSAKGDQYAFTATGNNVIVGPSWIEVATDGASSDVAPLYVLIELEYILNERL